MSLIFATPTPNGGYSPPKLPGYGLPNGPSDYKPPGIPSGDSSYKPPGMPSGDSSYKPPGLPSGYQPPSLPSAGNGYKPPSSGSGFTDHPGGLYIPNPPSGGDNKSTGSGYHAPTPSQGNGYKPK